VRKWEKIFVKIWQKTGDRKEEAGTMRLNFSAVRLQSSRIFLLTLAVPDRQKQQERENEQAADFNLLHVLVKQIP
jgi:hypothetical protein